MWRITALHRREQAGSPTEDGPPPLPDGVSTEELLPAEDGVGPLFHRRYTVRIREPELSPEEVVARLLVDPNRAAPTEFVRFIKVLGDKDELAVDDEFVVRMPGPWDGPVRVVAVTPTSFRLATLEGHLEAGQIEFRAADADGDLVFTIESWARSGDRLSRLLYEGLGMAKEVQLHMWTSFLERVARLAKGRMVGGIDIDTRRVDDTGASPLRDPDARRILDQLHDKQLNFEPGARSGFRPENGWLVDDYCQPLPAERPGPPEPGGSWEAARRILGDYEFADPAIVRAVYYADRPLDERDMLLEARFYGLRFRFGVRVGGVVDETRAIEGRDVRVWGWNYRTLQGHLEMGQMDFEVWKWLDTGEVEFHTSRFSRHAPVGNPVVRLGVHLFGRRQQVKFARRACERMARLTAAALDRPEEDAARSVPRVADEVLVRPVPAR
jgi:uncharacterized protein (UPF0548 family)